MSIKNDRLLSKAKKLLKKGEIKEARNIYLNILEYSPSNKEAKIGLKSIENEGAAQLSQEQLDYVIQLYSSGQMDKALLSIKELIQDFPNIPLLHNISGACNSALGEIDPSIISFNKAIELKPDYDEAYFNLGVAFHQTGQLGEAINCYERAISIKHAYPTAHNNLGLIALSQGQLDNALKSFEWAVAYSPEYAEAHNSLGAALQELKQFEKAKVSFKKAVALNPQYAQGLHNLAILCEIINLPDEASEYYEKALAVEPNYAEAYRNQSRTKKYKKNDPQIAQMQSIYSNDNLSISDKVHINFALAKVNEDLGNQKDFFKHLDEGSRLRKKQLNYNINETEEFHSSLVRLFSEDKPKIKKLSLGPLDIRPIFIVGMPRSGTSLVEQIISSHHSVHGAGELNNFKNIVTPALKNYIDNLGLSKHVRLLGRVSNEIKNQLLKKADLFVMPSYKVRNSIEGFGISYIEAASYGVPSIAGVEGGIRDAVFDMKTGWCVDPLNSSLLLDTIKESINNESKREKFGLEAKKQFLKKFLGEKVFRKFMNTINS